MCYIRNINAMHLDFFEKNSIRYRPAIPDSIQSWETTFFTHSESVDRDTKGKIQNSLPLLKK